MLNQIVKVSTIKGLEVQGKVYDATADMRYIHIETENDFYCIDTMEATVEVVEVEVKSVEAMVAMTDQEFAEMQIQEFLDEKGFEWDAYSCGGETTYEIMGYTYSVMLTVDEDSIYTIETTHLGRAKAEEAKETWEQEHSKAWANGATRKTLRGALNYTMKYLVA